MHHLRRLVFALVLCMVALVAAVGLGFGRMVDHVAIRDSGLHPPSVGHVAFAVHVDDGIDMPVYSTGAIQIGCVVIFPGQHGLAGGFEGHIAPLMASRGVAVFTPTYASTPNGPKLTLEQARRFASEVVGQVEKRCGPRYVVVGRSLGSMVAAYAVKNHRPAALLLEGASPSLAMAVRSALGRRLVQVPMPLERLLIKNYSLRDALGAEQRFPVTIFQGTLDLQTPIADLTEPGAVPSWIEIVQVPDADHQGTWKAAMPQIADRITGALTNRAL